MLHDQKNSFFEFPEAKLMLLREKPLRFPNFHPEPVLGFDSNRSRGFRVYQFQTYQQEFLYLKDYIYRKLCQYINLTVKIDMFKINKLKITLF